MGNAEAAKKLREKQAKQEQVKTKEALAASAAGKETVVAVEKLQEEMENIKLLLDETQAEKEELQAELESAKKTEAELRALLDKRAEEIKALTQDLDTANEALAQSKKEVSTLKAKVTKLEKR